MQDKIERLIDKHMSSLGAAKVSLSSISSEHLWQTSGRLDKGRTSELLRFEDRKGVKLLLSPTHEEEITTIVANAVHSYRELPLRLYQVSRKYRDEPRPRQGLLRGREFVMKDLYTFDADVEAARRTYDQVRMAYNAFFNDIGLPFLTARADSGNMGGTLSHEYHFASAQGEDTIVKCDECDYSMNEELYIGTHHPESDGTQARGEPKQEHYVSKDRRTRCTIYYPSDAGEPNIYAVKAVFPDVDTSLEGAAALHEHRKSEGPRHEISFKDPRLPSTTTDLIAASAQTAILDNLPIVLTKPLLGDPCPSCATGKLDLHRAIELGHTFHLGQRYSVPLEANVLDKSNASVPIEMGCHGIGVSRLIAACATMMSDDKGLGWPLSIAPFEVCVVPAGSGVSMEEMQSVYDLLSIPSNDKAILHGGKTHGWDVLLDDRERSLGWKLKDADLIGYPIVVVIGRAWAKEKKVEVQCRRLGLKEEVEVQSLSSRLPEIETEFAASLSRS